MAGLPFEQTVQKIVFGLTVGAGVTGAATGAGVNSPEQPQVPRARLCATRQSGGVRPLPVIGLPSAATCPHVTMSPSGENKNAEGFVTTPFPAQISHGNNPSSVGVGAGVGNGVGAGDGWAVGTVKKYISKKEKGKSQK